MYNDKTGEHHILRAFLDSGANLSAISREAAVKCGLQERDPTTIFLSTFNSEQKRQTFSKTTVTLKKQINSECKNITFHPFIMDKVMDPITSYPTSFQQELYLKENNIVLSDDEVGGGKGLKVDLLLGQEVFHQFHCSGPKYIPGGSILIETWDGKHILTGPIDSSVKLKKGCQISHKPNFLIMRAEFRDVKTFQNMGYSKKEGKYFRDVYSAITSEEEMQVVEQFRNLELLGISPADFSISPILEEFNESTKFENGRYVVKLPIREPQIRNLSNNFFQAFSRLMNGVKRRQKTKFALEAEKYKKSFEDEIKSGTLEKVGDLGTVEEVCQIIQKDPYYFNRQKIDGNRPVCYLPHQCVYKQSNGKFRRVHDAKARPGKGCNCLNDCLHKGDNLIASILHVLLGFRKNKYAFSSDIEKAFPCVAIAEEHRDLLRCLWIENGRVVIYRFARLPFGLKCSPFLLSATLRKNLGDNQISEALMTQFVGGCYMDDLISSDSTVLGMREKKETITKIFGECGMYFRDWNSNHPETQKLFAESEGRPVEELYEQLVLGLKWDTQNDTIRVNADRLKEKIKNHIKTKRDIWKVIPSVYDPIGVLAPFVLLGKQIVQEACEQVKNWDQKMPQTFVDRLLKWAEGFDEIENVKWPRFAGIENAKKVQLFGCCDASSYAMGGCIYLVSTDSEGKITSNLLLGKTLNKPKKVNTIPRLELTAAVLLCNMMSHVKKVYDVKDEDIHYFSDSSIVIGWLQSGDLNFKPYVANQIVKIKKASSVKNWHHIPGDVNPADLASRGASIKSIMNSSLWRNGPEFWQTGIKTTSKISEFDEKTKEEILKEVSSTMRKNLSNSYGFSNNKKAKIVSEPLNTESAEGDKVISNSDFGLVFSAESQHAQNSDSQQVKGIHNIIDINRVENHSYSRLMQHTTHYLGLATGFVGQDLMPKLREKNKPVPAFMKKLDFYNKEYGPELLWIQSVQRRYFGEIFKLLEKPKAKVSASSRSLIKTHAIFLDKDLDVLRCTTRNEKSEISYSAVFPILLPTTVKTENGFEDCMFTKLLVLDRHEKLAHVGTPNVLANLRSEFWLLKGRSFINKIIKKCVTCRKTGGAFYSKPSEPALPQFRVCRNKPFSGVGVDYVGPFYCRDSPKGKKFKAWMVTFSCGSTRAVHIEAVRSRKVSDFIFALDRFFSAYGLPESFISDNEKTFKKSAECLEQISKSNRVKNFLAKNRVSWNFYTPNSPNKGGFLERLNGPIKQAFYKSAGTQITLFEEFRSLAAHAAAVLNDRPICYVNSGIENSGIDLSPSMLLRGYNLNEPIGLNLKKMKDPKESKLSDIYFLSEKLKDKFWKHWQEHYLTELFERHVRNKKAQNEQIVPKIGEVVLISKPNIARRNWKMGRVVDVKTGRHGSIRQVIVQTLSDSKKQITKINRAPEKLVPILTEQVSEKQCIPLECGNEQVVYWKAQPSKYSKNEIRTFRKLKVFPPYTKSEQFKNPELENFGPEKEYVNTEKVIENEKRNW